MAGTILQEVRFEQGLLLLLRPRGFRASLTGAMHDRANVDSQLSKTITRLLRRNLASTPFHTAGLGFAM
jgi:hypothetical protein